MNAKLATLLSLVPERIARAHAGMAFSMPEAALSCAHPERLAFVAGRLNWMSPLERLTKDEQRSLGLMASSHRPAAEADEVEGEIESDLDGETESELEGDIAEDLEDEIALAPEFAESERQGSSGTLVAP